VLPVADGKKLRMGVAEMFLIYLFFLSWCDAILLNNL